ncbi:unnamed protein product [Nyctereutes procyonoides]|uniref:(raccoon dog) hypothetical protein n=1 Tax=Nyctereutes procyonoides TaxID=34880 RepID=A0A811YD71_NYCPR|nr:unnamed protein product [Nyctereutes procyonoides]
MIFSISRFFCGTPHTCFSATGSPFAWLPQLHPDPSGRVAARLRWAAPEAAGEHGEGTQPGAAPGSEEVTEVTFPDLPLRPTPEEGACALGALLVRQRLASGPVPEEVDGLFPQGQLLKQGRPQLRECTSPRAPNQRWVSEALLIRSEAGSAPLRTARCPLPDCRTCGALGPCRCAQQECHPPRPKRGPPETCCNLKPMHLLAPLKGILRLKANEETRSQSISVASVPRPKHEGRPRRAELRDEADKESPFSQPLIQGCFLQIWPQNEVSKGFKNAS